MLRAALANLRARKARMLLSSLAIVLGVAFVAGSFVFTAGMKDAFLSAFARDVGRTDVVVLSHAGPVPIPPGALATVRRVAGVAHAEGRISEHVTLLDGSGRPIAGTGDAALASVARDPLLRWQKVAKGRLPDAGGEVVLDLSTAKRAHLGVGDTVRVAAGSRQARTLRLVGLVDLGASPTYAGSPFLGVSLDQAVALTGRRELARIDVLAAPGVSDTALRDRVAAALGSSYIVRTAEEQIQAEVSRVSISLTGVTTVLLAFAAVAMFVAAIVIANTFAILLAQRARELALLRCVGATRGQVFRSVLVESAALGAVGSVAGVAAGLGLASGAGAVLGAAFDRFPFGAARPTPTAIVVPLIVGVLVTVVAAALPARAATRVAPVAALRERTEGPVPRRTGVLRTIMAALLVAVGAVGLALGSLALSSTAGFGVAFLGGLAAFLGILSAGPVLIPPVIRLVGALPARLLGVPARFASASAVRNPRRAAATTSALLVGATLISLLTVASASLRATATSGLDERFPVDYMVTLNGGKNVPGEVVDALRNEPALAGVAVVRVAAGRLDGYGAQRVAGVEAGALARVTDGYAALRALRPGEVVLTEAAARRLGLREGGTVRFVAADGGHEADLRVRAVIAQNSLRVDAVTTERDLERVAPRAKVESVLAKARAGVDVDDATAAVDRAVAGAPLTVTGAAPIKASFTKVLDTMLLIVSALLGVAVLIAFIGIANTLALSAVERRREYGVLRALGLTRGQLSGMLSGEAVLMAGVGGLLGVALGVVFGWAAVASLLPSSADIALTAPVGRIVAFVVVAGVAGLLASVLPARRAARTSVIAAMADE